MVRNAWQIYKSKTIKLLETDKLLLWVQMTVCVTNDVDDDKNSEITRREDNRWEKRFDSRKNAISWKWWKLRRFVFESIYTLYVCDVYFESWSLFKRKHKLAEFVYWDKKIGGCSQKYDTYDLLVVKERKAKLCIKF